METTQTLDLLTAVEQIVVVAQGSGLNDQLYLDAGRYIIYMSEKLDLTARQSVMMALFFDQCDDKHITLSDFKDFLNCRMTRLIWYLAEIDELEKRGFVICNHSNSTY